VRSHTVPEPIIYYVKRAFNELLILMNCYIFILRNTWTLRVNRVNCLRYTSVDNKQYIIILKNASMLSKSEWK